MPVATPEQYAEMLDKAKAGGYAFPAINAASSQSINAVLQGLTEAGSDGIIQVSTGGAMPIVSAFDHKPGKEKAPTEAEYRSDDCLWFFNAIPDYVAETGDFDFYNKVLPYADQGEATVLGHLRRAENHEGEFASLPQQHRKPAALGARHA